MGSFNHRSTRQSNFQVCLPSFSLLLLLFINPTEATDVDDDDDYNEEKTEAKYTRGLIAILGYFVIVALFIIWNCLRKRAISHTNGDEEGEPDLEHSITMTAKKLDVRTIESFPIIIYPPPSDAKFRLTECHICLEEFEGGDSIVVLPLCGHGYHKECALRWMTTRDSRCPDCRHDYGLV